MSDYLAWLIETADCKFRDQCGTPDTGGISFICTHDRVPMGIICDDTICPLKEAGDGKNNNSKTKA